MAMAGTTTKGNAFFAAIASGDAATVRRLLADGADCNARCAPLCPTWNKQPVTLGPTALMIAMRTGQDEAAKVLLAASADPLLLDQFGKSAAMYALEVGHARMESLVTLIDRMAAADTLAQQDQWGHNLIMYAALAGSAETVARLLVADVSGKSLNARVSDGGHELDLLTLSAKHGQGEVIGVLLGAQNFSSTLLESSRQVVTAGAKGGGGGDPRGERGICAALILACVTGHWIEQLNDAVLHELDEPDANGYTPIMHALANGQGAVARKLIAKGVACDELAPPREPGGPPRTLLMLAVQSIVMRPNETESLRDDVLETIKDLVKANAATGLPALDDRRYTSGELYTFMTDPSHVIGAALAHAASPADAEQVEFRFRCVRMMLVAAFREVPAAALSAFVALLFTMRSHADRVNLSDNELATTLRAEAMEVGTTVGLFVKTLPDLERERMLRSVPGENFLRFAAESNCRKICFAPAITHHISLRWSGELMSALSTGEGVYRWGGRLPLTPRHVWLLTAITPVAWVVNLLLLPAVAVYPPVADAIRAFIDTFGVEGVDPRDTPQRPEGKPGYSPTMRVWWRSLVLFDVPMFKFVTAQLGSLGLLGLLLYVAPCFDWDQHQECFADGSEWHMFGDGSGLAGLLLRALGFPLPAEGADLELLDGANSAASGGQDVEEPNRRGLKAGRLRVSRDSTGASGGPATDELAAWDREPPHLFGLSRMTVYGLLIIYACSVLIASVRGGGHIAASHTYASALASMLALVYLGLDLVLFYGVDVSYPALQPMGLSLAAFLLWLDVARAVLLKTYTCGPSVLMLSRMFNDVAVFLVLAFAIALGFALALFFNGMLQTVPTSASSMGLECPIEQGRFQSFAIALIEDLLGMGTVSEQVKCAKAEKDTISTLVLELYLIVGMILLLNMLIAMMGETFADVRSRQEEEYNFLNARIVISCDLEQGDIPPLLSVLRAPVKVVAFILKTLTGGGKGYVALDDSTSSSTSDLRTLEAYAPAGAPSAKPTSFTHVSAAELMDVLHEADMQSDKDDLAGLVLGAKDTIVDELQAEISALKAAVGTLNQGGAAHEAAGPQASDVTVYDGYHEEASRLVFPYSDRFQHLPSQPSQRTFLPSGVSENEAKQLPIYVEDEAPNKAKGEADMTRDQMLEKLKSRALTSYPFAQQVTMTAGEEIMREMGNDDYVYKRDNGEYGLSQIWPIKFNAQFKKSFVCSTTNPNPRIFHPQAVAEFRRTIERLFGAGATQLVPVVYAQSTRTNNLPIYKGTSEQLQVYLRSHPEAVDKLRIAKLYPGGFVAIVSTGGNPSKGEPPKKDGFKHFDLAPGETYVLYTKQGYESMACVKSAEQFEKECTLGSPMAAEHEGAKSSSSAPRELTA